MNEQFVQVRDLFLEALEHDGLESQLQLAAERCADQRALFLDGTTTRVIPIVGNLST